MPQLLTNLLTRDVERSASFYALLTGFTELRRSEAYVILAAAAPDGAALCLIDWVSELVPRAARGIAEGNYLSLVTEDVGAALAVARRFEVEIVEEIVGNAGAPARAVIRDLDGRVVELVAPAAHLVLPPEKTVA